MVFFSFKTTVLCGIKLPIFRLFITLTTIYVPFVASRAAKVDTVTAIISFFPIFHINA